MKLSFVIFFLSMIFLTHSHFSQAQGSALVPSDIFFSDQTDSSEKSIQPLANTANAITDPDLHLDEQALQNIVLQHHLTGHKLVLPPQQPKGKEINLAMIRQALPDAWKNTVHFQIISWSQRFETIPHDNHSNIIRIHLSRHGYIQSISTR
jgi:hypothetical protein